tara:strand:+ start:135 stop:725 length:591 start_codon:yes stop_codon:yes gene_type:complete
MVSNHIKIFFNGVASISDKIDKKDIEKTAKLILSIKKKGGRIFFLGVGGSAANCSHAVNDFRKLCNIESYAPTDNSAELTARINDEGWNSSFADWLKVSKLNKNDAVFIMSVGGGNLKKKISVNLVNAIKYAKKQKSKVLGIVGRKDGYTRKQANVSILVPNIKNDLITPYTEAFHSVVWHCLVSHPDLQTNKTKW